MSELSEQKKNRVKRRISTVAGEIEDELEYRDFGASDDLDYEMSSARLAAYNAEIAKLEKLL